jgi:hypothetical protein
MGLGRPREKEVADYLASSRLLRFLLIDPPAHALTPSCVHAQPLATGTIIHTQRRDLIMEEDGSKPVAAAAAQEEAEKQG